MDRSTQCSTGKTETSSGFTTSHGKVNFTIKVIIHALAILKLYSEEDHHHQFDPTGNAFSNLKWSVNSSWMVNICRLRLAGTCPASLFMNPVLKGQSADDGSVRAAEPRAVCGCDGERRAAG